jgi:parvulin-like peptidyl-prolyl isomerase
VLAAAGFAVLAASGCSTFTDSDVVARVGQVELTESQFAAIARSGQADAADAPTTSDVAATGYQDATTIINNWLLDRILRDDVAAAGGEIEGGYTAPDSRQALQASIEAARAAWQDTIPNRLSDADLQARYELGPAASGIACVAHILVDTEQAALDVLDRLAGGEPFAQVAADVSIDPGSATGGGAYPCDTAENFAATYIPEYVQAALGAEVGVPVGPVPSQFGYHVILVRPYADLAGEELEQFRVDGAQVEAAFQQALDSAEPRVYINPRFGYFTTDQGLTALG